ncbi:MAG: hypothetical protein DBW85_03160 [Synechococcus sp. MED-G71]|jgi:hypothetical protein|nr:MAG: hypothetical protein DBW85_03160 [Synechococcus sp. MED-G71]|tara:strand:- start:12587 stop:12778 length:192 start_codon:yes stop_codon:yes gene_type:complete
MPLPLSREFTVAMHERAIDRCEDVAELRDMAKSLLRIWQLQASMSEAYGAELLKLDRKDVFGG